MVKLAEARTKQRYTLVPRGKALYEDGERFGTKMLEKMGWSAGKGLGANEDGSKEFVRLRYKNDIQGLGYEARDDQWTQHEESFNGLLKNLNIENNEESGDSDVGMRPVGFGFSPTSSKMESATLKSKLSGESLEEKSKRSRARVHYKKFTRGKDLTHYSEKDLANIFGKKTLEESPESILQDNVSIIKENKLNEEIFQNSTLSVQDYFKEKMKARGQANRDSGPENSEHKSKHIEEVVEEVTNNELETFKKPKKEKKKKTNENLEVMIEDNKKKKKKNKKKEQGEEKVNISEEITITETGPKKIKKEKKKRKLEECTESAFLSEEVKKTIDMKVDVSIEPEPKKTKKEKKKNKESVEKSSNIEIIAAEKKHKKNKNKVTKKMESNKEECDIKKVKKKKKKSCHEINAMKEIQNNICEEKSEKKKKKEKSVKEINVNEMEASNVEKSIQGNLCLEKTKKKKKKNGIKKEKSHVGEKMQEENTEVQEENNIPEKNKETTNIDGTDLEITDDVKNAIDNTFEISNFVAEKFRFLNLDGFAGANLGDVAGYGYDENIKLKIVENKNDEKRIMGLWTSSVNKYETNPETADEYKTYVKESKQARKKKEKLPRFKVEKYKRRSVVKGVQI